MAFLRSSLEQIAFGDGQTRTLETAARQARVRLPRVLDHRETRVYLENIVLDAIFDSCPGRCLCSGSRTSKSSSFRPDARVFLCDRLNHGDRSHRRATRRASNPVRMGETHAWRDGSPSRSIWIALAILSFAGGLLILEIKRRWARAIPRAHDPGLRFAFTSLCP